MSAHSCPCQQGHVLTTGLIIMLLISLLGSSLFHSGWLESRMAASWHEEARQFQQLELGLQLVETTVLPGLEPRDPGPWIVTVNPARFALEIGSDLPAGIVAASVHRLSGNSMRSLGSGTDPEGIAANPDRYRIVVSLPGSVATGRRSLQAISSMLPGVRL